jgi:sugar lactone lactonase YvrE
MKSSKSIFALLFVALLVSFNLSAQDVAKISEVKYTDLPDLFGSVAHQHAASTTIAEFPKGTFFENIVVNSQGEYYVTSVFDGKIYRFAQDGTYSQFAQIRGMATGITLDKNENVVAVGAVDGKVPSVFHFNKNGTLESTTTIEGGWLLNGVTRLKGDKFLIADSYTDRIFEFDLATKQYSVWLADESISRTAKTVSIPGVNGLEVFGNTVYVSNMDKAQIVKVPIQKDGKAGTPQVFVQGVFVDDFSLDKKGNIYLTTHAYNSVVKIAPDGTKTIVGEKAEGLFGATSLAFGRGKNDKNSVYVVTNGGVLIPSAEGLQPAKVVRLDTDKAAITNKMSVKDNSKAAHQAGRK